jgi:hypothetical protein
MIRKSSPRPADEALDRLGRLVVRAAAEPGPEAREAADSPFLYARVRARVEERRRAAEREVGWLALLDVARRAVPAMGLVTALAAALLLWFAWFGAAGAGQFDEPVVLVGDDVIYGRGAGVESAVLRQGASLTHDEILEMVVNREGREAAGR